jgi:hypothetical protein
VNETATSPDAVPGQLNPSNWSEAGTASQTQFISFAIGDDQYGVDIMAVREIKGWTDITHLPKQPEYVRGVLNLRGAIVPIVDLRCRPAQARRRRQWQRAGQEDAGDTCYRRECRRGLEGILAAEGSAVHGEAYGSQHC